MIAFKKHGGISLSTKQYSVRKSKMPQLLSEFLEMCSSKSFWKAWQSPEPSFDKTRSTKHVLHGRVVIGKPLTSKIKRCKALRAETLENYYLEPGKNVIFRTGNFLPYLRQPDEYMLADTQKKILTETGFFLELKMEEDRWRSGRGRTISLKSAGVMV